MDILEQLRWRYATKKFDTSRKLTANQLNRLLESINLSASSYGLQPFEVFVIENKELRQQLREVSRQQAQVTDASHLIVFAAKTNLAATDADEHIQRLSAGRNLPISSFEGYHTRIIETIESKSREELAHWAAKQVYIALGFLLVACAVEKIDACPIEGFNKAEFDRILKFNEKGLASTVLAAVGYRSTDDSYQRLGKVRKGINELVTFL